VGRAQEGRGQAEAELCSSTSYDVCELWNNGGIARVFGRPKILEFVFHDEAMEKGKTREFQEHTNAQDAKESTRVDPCFYERFKEGKVVSHPTAGIYKPHEYVQVFNPPERTPLKERSHHSSDDAHIRFAPNPNLSLNVGIKKHSRIALCSAAIFGCLLQTSVLGYGAWAIYTKGLRKQEQSALDPYFWLTVSGTVLLVVGMFLCARLIEKSTLERTFTLDEQVFWLQPGNQRVGDQNFEAFAYSVNPGEYTTSWKEERREDMEWRKSAFVWLALSTSTVGFVLQFTGLRGLHSSVAMYQFAATLVMAFVRSLLRAQRLKESENLLRARKFQSQVEGHELDWQILMIERTIEKNKGNTSLSSDAERFLDPSRDQISDTEFCWSIIDTPFRLEPARISDIKADLTDRIFNLYVAELLVNETGSAAWSSCLGTSGEYHDVFDERGANALVSWISRVEQANDSTEATKRHFPNLARRLLCYRSRLSYLTNDDAPTTAQRWNLPVREQAKKLQAAIESVANYVFSDACQATIGADWGTTAAFCWVLNCETARRPAISPLPIHFMVRRVRGQWRINICQLEAVLGLWTWSIKTEVEKHKKCEQGHFEEAEMERNKTNKTIQGDRVAQIGEMIETRKVVKYDRWREQHAKMFWGKYEPDYDVLLSRKRFTLIPTIVFKDPEHVERNRDLSIQVRLSAERDLNLWILREQRPPVYDYLPGQPWIAGERLHLGCKTYLPLSLPITEKLLFRSKPNSPNDQLLQTMEVLSVQTENSVLVMASQGIFTSFIDALASITKQLKGVNVVQSLRSNAATEQLVSTSKARPFLGLSHSHTERLADIFMQAGLGT